MPGCNMANRLSCTCNRCVHGNRLSSSLCTCHLQDQGQLLYHEVEVLTGGAPRQLFRQAARLSSVGPSAALQQVEAAIVKACGGLPLALKLVGGLLRGKVAASAWQVILHAWFDLSCGFVCAVVFLDTYMHCIAELEPRDYA
jgi:hypothetical protein